MPKENPPGFDSRTRVGEEKGIAIGDIVKIRRSPKPGETEGRIEDGWEVADFLIEGGKAMALCMKSLGDSPQTKRIPVAELEELNGTAKTLEMPAVSEAGEAAKTPEQASVEAITTYFKSYLTGNVDREWALKALEGLQQRIVAHNKKFMTDRGQKMVMREVLAEQKCVVDGVKYRIFLRGGENAFPGVAMDWSSDPMDLLIDFSQENPAFFR